MKKSTKVYLGADHAGFALKEKIKEFLSKKDIYFEDLGSYDINSEDDYPDFAFKVGERVAKHKGSKGILVCGTGTGMVLAANKIKGIRAVVGYDKYSVKMSRRDNNANILCLRGRKFSSRKNLKLIWLWLNEEFSGLEKYKRRLKKIEKREDEN